ncbi:MAG: NAD(P)H-dependent oxidoreductase subunit E [Anaerotruncus sp.]|nr:NAD(P)H-dependent oxidoreductase subunit E [Anaerotruncus sp.]
MGNDPSRLVDVAREIQARLRLRPGRGRGRDPPESGRLPADGPEPRLLLLVPLREAEGQGRHPALRRRRSTASSATSASPKAFSEELGIPVGGTTPDGAITLERTACIGMSDQAPAALVNDVRRHRALDATRRGEIVAELQGAHGPAAASSRSSATATTRHPLVRSMVQQQHPAAPARSSSREYAPRRGARARPLAMSAGRGDPRSQDGAPARPRRRRLPHRHEVGVRARGARRSASSSSATPTRASRARSRTACC